jgi:hypothetical protein
MSRFVKGINPDNFSPGNETLPKTGGTVIGNISSTVTPSSNSAVILKSQVDSLTSGGASSPTNGQRVFSVLATQASGHYGHSACRVCTFTVPANTSRVFIQVWGGGGGGGGFRCRDHGTPGGAGGYSHGSFSVCPGDVLCITAGRGGCRGCCAQNGFSGSISTVCNATRGIQIRAYAGSGGRCSFQQYSGEGSCFGCGVGGQFNINGQREHSDTQCSCHRYCDGRAHAFNLGASPFTFGGYTAIAASAYPGTLYCSDNTCGLPNCSPGGGGSHGGRSYPGLSKGGSGGPGLVMIWH